MKKLTLQVLMMVMSLILLPTTLNAQLLITNQGAPAATILNGFIGSGLTISNPVLNCPANAYGTFSGGAPIGVTTGVVMTTGNASQVANPESYFMSVNNNTSCNDPQLGSLEATADYDCCILEFDVVPQCNQLSIRFVFGSEEYPAFVNSSYNDAFGFFITGPNPAGGNYNNKNIAIVTGTTICSIDNVNSTTNNSFYVNNTGGTTLPFGGYTTAITSSLAVTPCQSYHFKIAIADASDHIYDSGVFIDFLQCTTIMTASLTATPDNCSAGNGTATVTVQNGLGPLNYTWSPAPGGGQGTTTATGLTAGVNYTCTVDDNYSCILPATASIVIPGTVGPVTTASSNGPLCAGTSLNLFASNTGVAGTTYSWTGPNGFTSNLQNPTISNATTAASGNYIVTVSANGCTSQSNVNVTVNPVPTMTDPTDLIQCAGTMIPASSFVSNPSGATFNWTNNNSNIGLAASGTGNYASFLATNSSSSPIVSTITVIPSLGTCSGPSQNFTITVNPIPIVNTVNDITVCSGSSIPMSTYNSTPTGATFSWVNSNTSIGLGANGTGNTPTFTASNLNPNPITGIISVTPSLSGCVGNALNYTITVNPVPVINPITAITQCVGTVVATSNYTTTPSGATFNWTNDNVATGIAANGTGNIPSFTGTNTTSNPLVSTLTVTPSIGTCIGTSTNYTITINPGPTTTAGSNSPICEGTDLLLTATNTGVAGTNFAWSGPGGFSSNLQNPTITSATTAHSGTYTVTVSASGCSSSSSVDVTVNPVPVINPITAITQCVGTVVATSNYTATPSGATFTWTNDNVATGIAANGTGNIPSFTGTNTTSNPQVSTLTVTPSIGTCIGTSTNYTITINPGPTTTAGSNSPICEGTDLLLTATNTGVAGTNFAWSGPGGFSSNLQNPTITSATTAHSGTYTVTVSASGCSSSSSVDVTVNPVPVINPITAITQCVGTVVATSNYTATPSGATFTWTNDNVATGIAANGTGNIPSFTGTNTTSNPQVSTLTVTPSIGTCIGTSTNYTITINPGPTTTAGSNSPICAGTDLLLTATNTGVAGTNYVWSGPGGFDSNVQNPTLPSATTAHSGTYTVTVSASGCSSSSSVVVTVNPVPVINPITAITQCVGTVVATSNYTATPSGATFTWTNDNVATGIAANGTGNIPSFTGTNTTSNPQVSTLTVTPSIGTCIGTSTNYTITINPGPTTTAGSNSPICAGTDLLLTATNTGVAGTNYVWSGPGGFDSNVQNPTLPSATTAHSGTYTVTVSASGCSSSSSVDVTVNPVPTTTAMVNSPICEGEDLNLQADPFLNSVPGVTYSWVGPNFTSAEQLPTIIDATTLASGSYVVTVTANGCSSLSTIDAIVNPIPTVNVNSNSPVCEGEDLLLTASDSPGASYYWIGPNDFNSSDQNPVLNDVLIENEGVYSVVITVNGCFSGASTGVMINEIPVVVAGSNSPVCEGEAISLTSNNNTGAMFQWTGPNNFTSSSQNANIFTSTLNDAGTYTVTVTKNWCTASATVDVVVNEMPKVNFVADDFEGCAPLLINFTNNSSPASNSVTWNFGDGTTATSDGTVAHTFTGVGCYDITLSSTTNGCTSSLTQNQMVCVLPDAIADFSSNQLSAMLIEPNFEFYNNSSNASIYSWNFGDGATSNTTNATHTYAASPGHYIVQLIANNVGGCPDTAYLNVEVKDELIFYVPNTFTPDNDKFNQTFQPVFYSGYDPQTYTLLIFNRWGEVVFESHDVDVGWDGTYGGVLSQDGSYTWKITFNDSITDETYQYLGHINLIR
jgi:gliding motility-associated-like protein